MRIIGFVDHRAYKISIFSWSEKYIIKIEAGYFEQSYKFKQEDNLILYKANPIGFAYFIKMATTLFFFLGDENALFLFP